MDRIAISFGKINIYWYSIMILIGIALAYIVCSLEIRRQNINKSFFINLVFYIIIFGIIGARLYYVAFNYNYYASNPKEILMIWHGGLAIHGGILAGALFTLIYTKKYKLSTLKTIDVLVVGLIIAQIIGRWGNFFNQEAYGMVTTEHALEALRIPKFIINGMFIDGAYRQPTFLYESLWNFIGLIILLIKRRLNNTRIGELTGIYMIWYSIGRLFIEHFRSDSLMLGPIKVAQIVSILFIILGAVLIALVRKKPIEENIYNKRCDDIRF